jgi:hypothetical protein
MTELADYPGADYSSLESAPAAALDLSQAAPLDVRLTDIVAALITAALSASVLADAMSANADFALVILLHGAVCLIPLLVFVVRAKRGDDLTVPMLLVIATVATGPIGALGCALMALVLRIRRPEPLRLQHWYDYISGVVARRRVARLYDELVSNRLPSDPSAKVPRFNPILHDISLEDQQRVLAVVGRRYHADFRPTLRKALRHKNGFIRAQAAAIASRLSGDEKARLWTTGEPQDETAPTSAASALDVEPPPS